MNNDSHIRTVYKNGYERTIMEQVYLLLQKLTQVEPDHSVCYCVM